MKSVLIIRELKEIRNSVDLIFVTQDNSCLLLVFVKIVMITPEHLRIRNSVGEILAHHFKKLFKMAHVRTAIHILEHKAMAKNVDQINVMKDNS